MAEVGTLYASLSVSARGISQQISNEMGQAGSAGGRSAQRGFLSNTVGLVGKTVGIAAGAIGAVGGIIGGLAVKGGIAKALALEDAQAKLKGLGHDTGTVQKIMDNALASVKGTAYGMGDAASVAAGAVAAGIKPGQDLERTLKLTGDAATIAGSTMGEMGAIFNKVASSDMIQGDVLAQLGDRGIPILQLLGNELGVTSAEVKKMASKGEIDFATFQNAMEKGMGGAALKSGDTTRGALANMKSSFSNFGMVLTGWFMPLMKNVFGVVNKVMDGFTKALKPVATAFGEVFQAKAGPIIDGFGERVTAGLGGALEFIGPVLSEVSGGVRAFVAAFKDGGNDITSSGFAGVLETVGLVLGNLWKELGPSFKQLLGPVVQIAQALSPLGLIFAAIAPSLPMLATAAGQLGAVLADVLVAAVGALVPLLVGALTAAADLVGWFTSLNGGAEVLAVGVGALVVGIGAYKLIMGTIAAVTKGWAIAQGILNAVMAINPIFLIIAAIALLIAGIVLLVMNWDTVVGFLKGIWQGFVDWLTGVMDGFLSWWGGVWDGFLGFIAPVWESIKNVIAVAWAVIVTVVTTYINIVLTVIKAVWETIKVVFSTAWNIIQTIVATALSILIAVFTGNFGAIAGLISSAWTKIMGYFSGAFAAIQAIVGNAWAAISLRFQVAVAIIKALLSGAWNAIKTTTSNVWNSIVAFFVGIPGRLLAGLAAIGGFAIKMGAWVGSMKDAAVNKFVELVSWVAGLPGRITGALGNLGSLLSDAGHQIIQGFLDGLTAGFDKVKNFVGGIGEWIKNNKGPKPYDLALLVPAGGWIMTGLDRGLRAGIPMIGSTLGDVSGAIESGLEVSVRSGLSLAKAPVFAGDPGWESNSSRGAHGSGVTNIFNELSNPRATAYQVARLQEGY